MGVWFISKCIEKGVDAHYAVSPRILEELSKNEIDLDSNRVRVFEHSPARSKQARFDLIEYERSLMPGAVFTVFGPAYVNFVKPHICGFADGWLSHSTWTVYKKVFKGNWLVACQLFATSVYKAIKIRQANAWVFEANVAADGLAKRAMLPRDDCFVIPNNCSDNFTRRAATEADFSGKLRFLYFTADYAHKGISNYLEYAKALVELAPELDFAFVITISETSDTAQNIMTRAKELGIAHRFNFCGYVSIDAAVTLIDSAHIIMQTSYLETFSANYPEAMSRQRPLVVSDFKFARDVCQDAACYVNPDKAKEVAESILKLCQDPDLVKKHVECGRAVLADLPNSEQRFAGYMTIIKTIAQKRSASCVE